MKKIFVKFLSFLPAFIWMSVIFYFSSRPTTGVPGNFTQRFLILKSFHLIEYAILFLLLFFAYQKIKISLFTAYLYSLTDEFHQTFVYGREGRFRDTLIDLIGIIIGLMILKILARLPLKHKMSR